MTWTNEQAILHTVDRDIIDLLLERYLEGALPTGAISYLINHALHIVAEEYARATGFALYNVEENTAGAQYDGYLPVLLSDIAELQDHFEDNTMPARINNIRNQMANRRMTVNDIHNLIHDIDDLVGFAAFDDLYLQEL